MPPARVPGGRHISNYLHHNVIDDDILAPGIGNCRENETVRTGRQVVEGDQGSQNRIGTTALVVFHSGVLHRVRHTCYLFQ